MSRHSLIARAAPARGQVITSKEADAATLLVVSHLRDPNCADGAPAYPCPQGVEENRNDHGMGYLGQALAAAGYTVIVPDLGGLLIGADTATPYDQNLMWRDVVGRFVQTLTAPTAAQTLGVELPAGVDAQNVGLVVHSRSSQVVAPAQELFGATALKALLAYGPPMTRRSCRRSAPPPPTSLTWRSWVRPTSAPPPTCGSATTSTSPASTRRPWPLCPAWGTCTSAGRPAALTAPACAPMPTR